MLLIFDGLDELATDDVRAKDIAVRFVTLLERVTMLGKDRPRLRALVLGRDAACEEAMRYASLPSPTMLRVAPLDPLKREDLMLPKQKRENLEDLFDPESLFEVDQRPLYWKRWALVKGEKEGVPEVFTATELEDLTVEPLLLHLLIISGYAGSNWRQAADNRNLMYKSILSKIHERNSKKEKSPVRLLSADDFFLLMEALGFSAWQGNGRTGNDEEFNFIRDLVAGPNRFSSVSIADLKSVALQIHTREGEQGKGFEFIHKSFGEYLAARALVGAAIALAAELGPTGRKRREDIARDWCWIVGPAELTEPIISHLKNEARLIDDVERLREAFASLLSLFNQVEATGFPVEAAARGGHGFRSDPMTFRRLEALDRCASSAMLAVLSSLVQTLPFEVVEKSDEANEKVRVKVSFSEEDSRRSATFLHRIGVSVGRPIGQALGRLALSNAELSHLNFGAASLREASFIRARLDNASFAGADLVRAVLREAEIYRCSFQSAVLDGADFAEVSGFSVSFSAAFMRGISFMDSRLPYSNFFES